MNAAGCHETLPGLLSARLARVEGERLRLGFPQHVLAAMARVDRGAYRDALAGRSQPRSATLARLEAALAIMQADPRGCDPPPQMPTGGSVTPPPSDERVHDRYLFVLGWVAPPMGADPAAVLAQDPRRGATADREWRRLARVRQAAIYLTNTALGVPQSRLARVLGLTPAAVCLGLRSVEERRSDPDFDALLERIGAAVQMAAQPAVAVERP